MAEEHFGVSNDGHIIGSMDELKELDEVEYAVIPGFTPGKTLRIGSLTAGDLIEWSEASEGEAKRTAGLRLICKSLVGPPPGNMRYANDPKNIAVFRAKRHKATEEIVKAILKLNGMEVKISDAAKNG
jgi:hypothetical protein